MRIKLAILAVALLSAAAAHAQNVLSSGTPLTPINSTALEASHIIKAAAGNLASLTITDSAAEYILIMDSATLPANGAVTLLYPPIKVAANTTTMVVLPNPYHAANGITVCNSSTGTFTKTIGGSTCIFSAQIQ